MKIAFVVSSGRSGSTLLASMLNMHRNIHVPVELLGLYSSLPARLKYYGDLRRERNRSLLGRDLQHIGQLNEFSVPFDAGRFRDLLARTEPSLRSILACFYETLLPAGKSLLVDKTPNSSIYHRRIGELFPDAKFIHLVRDGRDVALSSMRSRKGVNHRNLWELGVLWNRNNLRLAEFGRQFPSRYHRLRYEDLVADPPRELESVCGFLAEPYSDALLEFASGEFARENVRTLGHHGNLGREVMRENVEKWRREMTPNQIELFETLAAPALREFGYACSERARSLRTTARMVLPWTATQWKRMVRSARRARVEATFRAAVLARRVRHRRELPV